MQTSAMIPPLVSDTIRANAWPTSMTALPSLSRSTSGRLLHSPVAVCTNLHAFAGRDPSAIGPTHLKDGTTEPVVVLPVFADLIRASHHQRLTPPLPSLSTTPLVHHLDESRASRIAHGPSSPYSESSESDCRTGESRPPPPCRPISTGGLKRKPRPVNRMCKIEGCEQYVVDHGLCVRHGGGKRCTMEGCSSRAKHYGRCWRHGGSMECKVDGCANRAKSRGYCWSHGGGTRCKMDDCEKIAISNGLCWAHGGGKRCSIAGCMKQAYERTLNLCNSHHQQAKREAARAAAGTKIRV